VLFSDIRGFTAMTEELGAQATVSLLNDYFTRMVECVQLEGGMLDKFIGDALMAVFGIPLAAKDDPDRAVRAAIAMVRALRELNAIRADGGLRPLDIGIGINTATIVSGNIGSPKRMDYTVVGDGVNLASRIESACKLYGTRILVSEHTFHALKGTYRSREVDRILVSGKTHPIGVHEILDYHDKESFPDIVPALAHFRDGMDGYRGRRWKDALTSFESAAQLHPEDRPAQLYVERCAQLAERPPADDWDGVWRLTSK